jgi:hypothetical protein
LAALPREGPSGIAELQLVATIPDVQSRAGNANRSCQRRPWPRQLPLPVPLLLLLPSCITTALWSERGFMPEHDHFQEIDLAALGADDNLYLHAQPGNVTLVAPRLADGTWGDAVATDEPMPPSQLPVRIVESGVLWPPLPLRDGELLPLLTVDLRVGEGGLRDQVKVLDTRGPQQQWVRLPGPSYGWDDAAMRVALTPVAVAADVVLLPLEIVFFLLLPHLGH